MAFMERAAPLKCPRIVLQIVLILYKYYTLYIPLLSGQAHCLQHWGKMVLPGEREGEGGREGEIKNVHVHTCTYIIIIGVYSKDGEKRHV